MSMLSRRQILKTLAACAAGGAIGAHRLLRTPKATAQPASGDKKPAFLIVIGGFGGASIIDSFLAIRNSESANSQTINTLPDNEVIDVVGSPFRAVDLSRNILGVDFTTSQSAFVEKYQDDMMVTTMTSTSVNHTVAQKRSITGNGAWSGRTLQEAVALQYGEGYLLPNVNMASLGFLENGDDPTLPSYCYAEPVAQPALWPLSLDGARGIKDAPDPELIELARATRNDELDPRSAFYQTFRKSERLQQWLAKRTAQPGIESENLINKLNIFPDAPPHLPLSEYGLGSSADAAALRAVFPAFLDDPMDAQAALAFLLLKNRVSVAVTLSPSFNIAVSQVSGLANLPLAFDFSHQDHRAAQAFMWQRTLSLIDRLITLLKAEELDPATGESFWDRTLIYVASDFGRSRNRAGGNEVFSSGHDLNNGNLIISPLVNGNTLLGGVDPDTGLTYGFDPQTGAAAPNRVMSEGDIYAGILHALGVSTTGSGLPDMPAMRRGA